MLTSQGDIPVRTKLVTIALVATACATTPQKPPAPPYNPDFTYQTKAQAAPNSAGVTVAIVSPEWLKADKDMLAI
jgi:hypothetical protein